MKKYIFYAVFLILWSIVLSVFDEDRIEIVIVILICILYELIEINDKKEGN